MKKIFSVVCIMMLMVFLSACQKPKMSEFSYFYMDTEITIFVYTTGKKQEKEIYQSIDEIYGKYHELTNNYAPLSTNAPYLENLYSINQKINQKLQIDKELYDIFVKADEIKTLTDGYFDISVGKIVKVWKELILDPNYIFKEAPKEIFDLVVDAVETIDVVENPFILSVENNKYYIEITDDDVMLDLGAFAKGYATQIVYDYLRSIDREYFSISAGSSSLSIGKNKNRETGLFHTSLANPIREQNNQRTYGMIYVNDMAINTSGNYEQYTNYQGLRYHHVVSPKTKTPMQYYHTVTILGQDAGLLDALSTALFSMPPNVFEAFINAYQETYQLEIIRFNYDGSITTYLTNTDFEDLR